MYERTSLTTEQGKGLVIFCCVKSKRKKRNEKWWKYLVTSISFSFLPHIHHHYILFLARVFPLINSIIISVIFYLLSTR